MLAFLYVPIFVICLYAFNSSNVQSWPIAGLTTKWFSPTIHNGDMQQALFLSLKAAALATLDRTGPRLGRGIRRAPLPVLRP